MVMDFLVHRREERLLASLRRLFSRQLISVISKESGVNVPLYSFQDEGKEETSTRSAVGSKSRDSSVTVMARQRRTGFDSQNGPCGPPSFAFEGNPDTLR
jgi:hypothetical protein